MKWISNSSAKTLTRSKLVSAIQANPVGSNSTRSITSPGYRLSESGKITASNLSSYLHHNITSRVSLGGALAIYLGVSSMAVAEDKLPFLQADQGLVTIEAEHFHADVAQGKHEWIPNKQQGYSGEGAMKASPHDHIKILSDYDTLSPRLDYKIEFSSAGTHYVWVRALGRSGGTNSIHVGLDGQMQPTGANIHFPITGDYTWNDGLVTTLEVSAPGVHTVNVWMRESGSVVDKLVLSTDAGYVPSGAGPAESPLGSGSPPPAQQGTDDSQGLIAIEAEHYQAKSDRNKYSWVPHKEGDYSGESAMMISPPRGRLRADGDYNNVSPQLDYQVKIAIPGTYYVWLRALGPNGGSNSVHLGLDGNPVQTGENITVSITGDYVWTDGMKTPIEISKTGLHTVNLWMRESGTIIDKIVLSNDPGFTPMAKGPDDASESATDQGSTDEGTTDDGSSADNRSTDNGSADERAADSGSIDHGSADEGSTGNSSTGTGSTGTGSKGNTKVVKSAACPAPSPKSKLLLVGDFEAGNFKQFSKWQKLTCCGYSHTVVSSPVRSGSHAMRTEMRIGDYHKINSKGIKKYRAELSEQPRLPPDIERWYGFSVYLPKGYHTDRGRDVVMQAHGPGNTGQQWEIHTTGGKWRSLMYSGPFEKYKAGDDLGTFQTGRWTDFVVHAKYAHQSGGIYEIWKDGVKVAKRTGAVGPSSANSVHLQFGLYLPGWTNSGLKNASRIVYHDEVRIADGPDGYSLVAPQCQGK